MDLGIPIPSPSYQATLPLSFSWGTFSIPKRICQFARSKLLGDDARYDTQSVQKLFIMQNVNFYKKFNIHHMITESHLPVKKVQKLYTLL